MLTVMFPACAVYLSWRARWRCAIIWKPPTLILRTPSALTAPSTTGITCTVWKPRETTRCVLNSPVEKDD